jgi:hypothetical protein
MVGEDGVLSATDHKAWSAALSQLWERPQLREQRGEEALVRARERFSETSFYDGLMRLYGVDSP